MATDVAPPASSVAPMRELTRTSTAPGITRRSLSIFSRRGIDPPAPRTQPLVAASMSFSPSSQPAVPVPRRPSAAVRSRLWKMKKLSASRIPAGTILRAVPKESPPTVAHAAFDREMAVSPNDEILRNIGLMSLSAQIVETREDLQDDFVPTSPTKSVRSLSSPRNHTSDIADTLSSRRPTVKARKDTLPGEFIGVWKDGKAQWGAQVQQPQSSLPEACLCDTARPKSAESSPTIERPGRKGRPQRPSIKVVIPNNRPARRHFAHVPFFSSTSSTNEPAEARRNSTPGRETSPRLSRDFSISPPEMISGGTRESFHISALSPSTVTYASKTRRVSRTSIQSTDADEQPLTAYAVRQSLNAKGIFCPVGSTFSGSSEASASDNDETPHRSRRTSMTSFSSKGEDERPPPVPPKDGAVGDHGRGTSTYHEENEATVSAFAGLGRPQTQAQDSQPRLANLVALLRTPSSDRPRRRVSSSGSNSLLTRIKAREDRLAKVEDQKTPRQSSPTLSQAEHDLEAHLYMLSNPGSPHEQAFTFRSSVTLPLAEESHVPPPPPKSARRYLQPTLSMSGMRSNNFRVEKAAFLRKQRSARGHKAPVKGIQDGDTGNKLGSNDAKVVLLNVLERVDSLDDLLNGALVNKGFYSVFKHNELPLMRKVLRNMCSPAWEYRETCRPNDDSSGQTEPDSAVPVPEYTPTMYYESYMRDADVIGALKPLILKRCQSILREETVAFLTNHDPCHPNPVDKALWRIWTFCRIFGCNKQREDDISAQIDWLKGGPLAHQEACTSTISTHDSFYLSSVLLGAPEHFAQGNEGGLSAEELFDMTEMWICLARITQGIVGLTGPARQYGVFDNTEVRGGDIDGEETKLEEWHHYLLTLGLSPILDLANECAKDGTSAIALSHERGWTNWTPLAFSGIRSTFLKGAVKRLYDERVCALSTPASTQASTPRELQTARRTIFAAEIRERRLLSVSVHSERPMSGGESVMRRLDTPTTPEQPSPPAPGVESFCPIRKPPPVPPTRTPPSPPSAFLHSATSSIDSGYSGAFSPPYPAHPALAPSAPQYPPAPPPAALIHPAFRTGTAYPTPHHSPTPSTTSLAPSDPPAYDQAAMQHPLQWQMAGELGGCVNSVDKAIFRIVEMGFSPEQAKGALKITDMGDGLRVDRAVEYLLRQDEGGY